MVDQRYEEIGVQKPLYDKRGTKRFEGGIGSNRMKDKVIKGSWFKGC